MGGRRTHSEGVLHGMVKYSHWRLQTAKGECVHGQRSLTEDQVLEIRMGFFALTYLSPGAYIYRWRVHILDNREGEDTYMGYNCDRTKWTPSAACASA